MSRVSNTLSAALNTLGLSQTEFSKICALPLSQINRYVRGTAPIGLGNLETVARHLPEPERADLVSAWLRDAIPQSSSSLVTILTGGRVAEQAQLFSTGELSRELDGAIRFLIDQARQHVEISDLLIDLERALRGKEIK